MSQIVQYKFANTSVLDLNYVIGSLLCGLWRCLNFSMQNAFCRTIDIIVGYEVSSPSPLLPAHQSQRQRQSQKQWQQIHRHRHVFACSTAKFACLPDGDKLSAGSELMTLIMAMDDCRVERPRGVAG